MKVIESAKSKHFKIPNLELCFSAVCVLHPNVYKFDEKSRAVKGF